MLAAGCQTTPSTSSSKTLTDQAAKSNAQLGANMAGTINASMGIWANSGSVSGVKGLGVKGTAVKSLDITAEADGWYHLTQSTTATLSGTTTTYEADLHIKLVTSESKVTDIYLYGSYSYALSYAGSSLSYTESFGSSSNPYHGSATWSGDTLTKIAAAGSMSFSVSSYTAQEGSHTLSMTYNLSNYSLPVTSGDDYPTGTISVDSSYDSVSQPTITLTFNGTSTATFSYGDYTSTITISAV